MGFEVRHIYQKGLLYILNFPWHLRKILIIRSNLSLVKMYNFRRSAISSLRRTCFLARFSSPSNTKSAAEYLENRVRLMFLIDFWFFSVSVLSYFLDERAVCSCWPIWIIFISVFFLNCFYFSLLYSCWMIHLFHSAGCIWSKWLVMIALISFFYVGFDYCEDYVGFLQENVAMEFWVCLDS